MQSKNQKNVSLPSIPPHVAEVICSLFVHRDAVHRHLIAPKLKEREAYLAGLQRAGFGRRFIVERATAVLTVDAQVRLARDGLVGEVEIVAASLNSRESQQSSFRAAARSWFKFLGLYRRQLARGGPFGDAFQAFEDAARGKMGREGTVSICSSPVATFLEWVASRRGRVDAITAADVRDFLDIRKINGWSDRTVHNAACALRTFFRFTEERGWSGSALSRRIAAPVVKRRSEVPRCPPWQQVLRMLDSLDCSDPSHCRAKAILLLAAIYGLRRSEIVRLSLDDFDWQSEIVTVRRSKRGRVQQFPIQTEVGDALIRYLREVRPPTRLRCLFLTLQRPYRSAKNLGPAMRKIMSGQEVFERAWGLHALRHACATELLRKGTSLRGIADLLGHRSLDSVSIYAQCDYRALQRVAKYDLSRVL